MEAGHISPVASMVEAGSQSQPKVQDTQKAPQSSGAYYMNLAQTRLVIELDGDSGGWVYKTVDAKNGQLLAQYPLRSAWEIILSQRSGLGLMVDAKA
jgi:hypothetical protein